MKKLLLISNFVLSLTLVFYLLYDHKTEAVVYVDSGKLLNGYEGMIEARADYQQQLQLWQANIDTLSLEVQRATEKYKKELNKMSRKEGELAGELLKTKQRQLVDYQRAIHEKAQQQDELMTGRILEQINGFITSYGKEEGYKIIMATTDGNIAYAQEGLDITDQVLDGLNENYSGI